MGPYEACQELSFHNILCKINSFSKGLKKIERGSTFFFFFFFFFFIYCIIYSKYDLTWSL